MRSWPAPDLPTLPVTGPEVALHDTATGALVTPRPEGPARVYVCGITPYDATHLGHAATYVAFDLLNRAWRNAGHDVTYVQNVTDVDDPLLERATKVGVDWVELAERETELFRQDMTALRVLPPTHYVGAVESIQLVVDLVKRLQDAGAIYQVEDDLYFSVTADPRIRRGVGADPRRDADGSSPSAGETPTAPARRTPSTAWCGWGSGRASRPGRAPSDPAAPAGTSSVRPSPWTPSAPPSTCRAAAAT